MKLTRILLGLILILLPLNLLSQIDSSDFFNLKLKSHRVQIFEKTDGVFDHVKNLRLPETYFFFTQKGIYGADEYGILQYEFRSPLTFNKQNQLNSFSIRGYDFDFRNDCTIVVYDYYKKDKFKIFFVYKKRQYVFDCDIVE